MLSLTHYVFTRHGLVQGTQDPKKKEMDDCCVNTENLRLCKHFEKQGIVNVPSGFTDKKKKKLKSCKFVFIYTVQVLVNETKRNEIRYFVKSKRK